MAFNYDQYIRGGKLPHIWCPGCTYGIVFKSLLRAVDSLKIPKDDVALVSGIGCASRLPGYVDFNTLHTTHGRALGFATGIKMAKPDKRVIVVSGDGDATAIGGNHFIHAARRNIDLTAIVINNFNYGMTGGQVSATTPGGRFTSTTSWGNPERDFDICALAEVAGANYVARETPYHGWEMKELIKEALNKRGFSLVEVFSPCPTHFGKNNEMRQTREMLDWFKQRGMPVERYRKLSAAEQENHFAIGKLVDRDAPDFNTRYEEIRVRANA